MLPYQKNLSKNTCMFNVLWLTFKDMFFVGWTTEASKLHFQKVQCRDARNIGIADLTISKHSASDGNNIKETKNNCGFSVGLSGGFDRICVDSFQEQT